MHRDIINSVEGFLSGREEGFLYNMAKDCKEGVIVEIGSWKGKSTVCLGMGSKAGSRARVYTIDPHRDTSTQKLYGITSSYAEFKNNIQAAGVNDVVSAIIKTSKEAAQIFNEPIEFLFIDGDHDYEAVKLDFQLWYPKVIYGGFIAFHDCDFSGPRKVIEKYILSDPSHFKDIGIVDGILFGRKVKKNSLRCRLTNMVLFFIYKCRDLYYMFPFPKPKICLINKILKALKIRLIL